MNTSSRAGILGAAILCAFAAMGGRYDVAAYVWPAYQPEPRWAELGIFKAGKGEWQNVWEAVPKWKGHVQPLKPLWGYENEADPQVVEKKIEQVLRCATGGGGNGDLIGANQNVWGGGLGKYDIILA